MVFEVKERLVFIPEWEGNKSLPEGEQIKVHICLPSAVKLAEIYGKYSSAATAEFLSYVDKIEGFKIGEKDAEPIDLLETPGLASLVVEIKNEYRKYAEIDKKK